MADLLITTADNEQFLAHHGIKGQEWGVWNDETRRKYGYYPASSSKKGQRLIAKADRERAKADRANSVTELHMRAMKVNANEITKQYAKSNVHTIKAQRSDSKAKKYADRSAEARTAGDERKARKLDAKATQATRRSELERNRARAEMNRGYALSNNMARTQVAERQLKGEATKHLNKAAKLEAKADKVIKKEDRKAEKAYDTMTDYSKYRLDKYREQTRLDSEHSEASNRVFDLEDQMKSTWAKVEEVGKKHGIKSSDLAAMSTEIARGYSIKDDSSVPKDVVKALMDNDKAYREYVDAWDKLDTSFDKAKKADAFRVKVNSEMRKEYAKRDAEASEAYKDVDRLVREHYGKDAIYDAKVRTDPNAPKELKEAINKYENLENSLSKINEFIKPPSQNQMRGDYEYSGVVREFLYAVKDPNAKQSARLGQVMKMNLSEVGATSQEAEDIIQELMYSFDKA